MIGMTLKNLLHERGLSVSELARRVDVSPQTLYSIIKRDNMKIDFDLLLDICRELQVSIEAFYPDGEAPALPGAEEWPLLQTWRKLDEHGRTMVRLVLEAEAERMAQAEAREPETRIIPLYYTPAAAGYASPALGEDYEDYTVPADSPADFAAHIQGDSMEPYIHDGDIVLVKRGTDLVPGDVGLFFVDGDMKCKQYCTDSRTVYLFSLNRARKDADMEIPLDSGITVFCLGRVLLERRPPLPTDY